MRGPIQHRALSEIKRCFHVLFSSFEAGKRKELVSAFHAAANSEISTANIDQLKNCSFRSRCRECFDPAGQSHARLLKQTFTAICFPASAQRAKAGMIDGPLAALIRDCFSATRGFKKTALETQLVFASLSAGNGVHALQLVSGAPVSVSHFGSPS